MIQIRTRSRARVRVRTRGESNRVNRVVNVRQGISTGCEDCTFGFEGFIKSTIPRLRKPLCLRVKDAVGPSTHRVANKNTLTAAGVKFSLVGVILPKNRTPDTKVRKRLGVGVQSTEPKEHHRQAPAKVDA